MFQKQLFLEHEKAHDLPCPRDSPLKTWNGHDHSGVGTILAMTSLRRWPPFRDKISKAQATEIVNGVTALLNGL
jgi:hypothetical protein